MKILISGYHNPHYPTITEYMERAVQSLGHELCRFDDRCHIIPGSIRYRIPRMHRLDIQYINYRLRSLVSECSPDIAVITGGHRITAPTIEWLKKRGVITALWTIDPPRHFQPILESAPAYDHLFCQGTEAIEIFDQAGISGAHWLPMACDPASHHPVRLSDSDKERYAHDLTFVGSFYPLRAELFEHLAPFDFAIWGPGWDNLEQGSPLRTAVRGTHTLPSEWLKIYSSSKIVLATHYQDPEKRFPVYQASPRVFEAMACGAFVLSDDQRDVLSLFNSGRELVCFSSAADLVEKVRYYLDHADELRRIAERGREAVLKHHTYVHRIEELVSIVLRRRPRP